MVARRQLYSLGWYRRWEKKFVGALEVRFELIRTDIIVMSPEEFLTILLGKQFHQKYIPVLAQVVRAIDKRALCKS
jgi:hypothetical protein